jgi:hypothetical protein
MEALTPNHLLLLQSGQEPPPGVFQKEDNYVTKKWRQVQYLTDVFWKRWRTEYLPLLQERAKWTKPERNVAKNDVVLIADSCVHRNSWPMGRVIAVKQDSKGHVRSATIKTKTSTLERPVAKLVIILEAD